MSTTYLDRIILGSSESMTEVPDACVQTVVTSPPYWAKLNYGVVGQIGIEATPQAYIARIMPVFAECQRALRADGTMWIVVADTYHGDSAIRSSLSGAFEKTWDPANNIRRSAAKIGDLKRGDLAGIPWMLALALRAQGWYVRDEIIWTKPAPTPTPARDRGTPSHERIFMLAKSRRYFSDYDAHVEMIGDKRNVWDISTSRGGHGHPATFPDEIARRCIRIGSRPGDLVLDPFVGAGTTALVAKEMGRHYVGYDLHPDYVEIALNRIAESHVSPTLFDADSDAEVAR